VVIGDDDPGGDGGRGGHLEQVEVPVGDRPQRRGTKSGENVQRETIPARTRGMPRLWSSKAYVHQYLVSRPDRYVHASGPIPSLSWRSIRSAIAGSDPARWKPRAPA
jgi:hypothetical protein